MMTTSAPKNSSGTRREDRMDAKLTCDDSKTHAIERVLT